MYVYEFQNVILATSLVSLHIKRKPVYNSKTYCVDIYIFPRICMGTFRKATRA